MNPHDSAINRAMAEVAGWTEFGVRIAWGLPPGAFDDGSENCLRHYPYYLTDLNAVHEVIGAMLFSQRRAYREELKSILLPGHTVATEECIDATARQRTTAILKTLSRWNPEWD